MGLSTLDSWIDGSGDSWKIFQPKRAKSSWTQELNVITGWNSGAQAQSTWSPQKWKSCY